MGAARSRFRVVLAFSLTSLVAACGGASNDAGPSRAETYQRTNPREGIAAPGATASSPRDMPGSGRGSNPPRGK